MGDIGKTQSGIGFPDIEQGGTEGLPFYKVSDMNNVGNEHEMTNSNNYVNEEQIQRKKWKPIETVPTLIFAKVGAAIMLNRKRLVREPFLIDNNTMAYVFAESWDTDFGKTLFETINLPRYAQVGALPSYNGSDIESISVSVPYKDEQQKIGEFFQELDNLITLHQRKYDALVKLKDAYLQNMFPAQGESVPKFRFANFSGGWKRRKLKEVADFNPKSVLPDEFEYVDLGSVIGTDLVAIRTEKIDTAPSRAQRLARKGDVFYQTVRPYQKNNYLYDLPYDNYVFSTGYAQMRPKVESYFLFSFIQEEKFVQRVLDRCTGTGYPAINSTDLAEIEIQIPTEMNAQKIIGNFFKIIDDLITLHQKKLQKLKYLKKAYLQKMFL